VVPLAKNFGYIARLDGVNISGTGGAFSTLRLIGVAIRVGFTLAAGLILAAVCLGFIMAACLGLIWLILAAG